MFKKFSHPMLFVTDLNRAVTWYKDVLGFKENFVAPDAYASLRHEAMNFRLDLHPTEMNSKDVGAGPMPYFMAEDLEKTMAALIEKGARVGEPKTEGGTRFVTFWDSEGNALGVEEARK